MTKPDTICRAYTVKKKSKEPILIVLERVFPELTRNERYARILCGEVFVDGERVRSPKRMISAEQKIEIKTRKYVSRGGSKLEAALRTWHLSVNKKIVVDIGCSTGGFTDCLLQAGASIVHSVDVGYNQLDFTLRNNPKVVVHERKNIMHMEKLEPTPHGAVVDVSFRSIAGICSHALSLTREQWLIALVKPQFEWKSPDGDFDGVVREPKQIQEIVAALIDELWEEGAFIRRVMLSPIRGRKGNVELLFYITHREAVSRADIKKEIGVLLSAV